MDFIKGIMLLALSLLPLVIWVLPIWASAQITTHVIGLKPLSFFWLLFFVVITGVLGFITQFAIVAIASLVNGKSSGNQEDRKSKITPFPTDKSPADQFQWFKTTPPWDQIDERILSAIISKFRNNPTIIVFVVTSMRHNLIPIFSKLISQKTINLPDLICTIIAPLFYDIGSDALKKLKLAIENPSRNQDHIMQNYSTAMDSLDVCISLDENQYPAYLALATAKMMINRHDEAYGFARKGLDVITKIRDSNTPFHLSEDERVCSAMESIEGTEKALRLILGTRD